jgi:hypothetical protein
MVRLKARALAPARAIGVRSGPGSSARALIAVSVASARPARLKRWVCSWMRSTRSRGEGTSTGSSIEANEIRLPQPRGSGPRMLTGIATLSMVGGSPRSRARRRKAPQATARQTSLNDAPLARLTSSSSAAASAIRQQAP